jgi:hypothetical protein
MRYPKFHARSLCTSTGVLEAGCKVAIGTRLKRAGMHWSVGGANTIIALRCARLSGRFEDFCELRRNINAVGGRLGRTGTISSCINGAACIER